MLFQEHSPVHGAKVAGTLHLLVESLLLGLGPRVTPELKAFMRASGLDLDDLPPGLTLEQWLHHRRRLARVAFPEVGEAEALRLLGLHFLRGWRKTPTGSAISYVLALLGPARCLTRLERAFRTTDPSTRARGVVVGPNEALVTIDDVHGDPSYWVGVIEGGLELLRREGEVRVQGVTPPGVTLRVRWR